jgi:hypothetical protein
MTLILLLKSPPPLSNQGLKIDWQITRITPNPSKGRRTAPVFYRQLPYRISELLGIIGGFLLISNGGDTGEIAVAVPALATGYPCIL